MLAPGKNSDKNMSASFPSVRLVLHARPLKDGAFSVALRVTFRRKSKFFFLNRHCLRSQWSEKSGRFEKSFPDHKRQNDMLLTYERRASDALRDMERDGVTFTFEKFEAAVFGAQHAGGQTTLVSFLQGIATDLEASGKFGNSRFYKAVANAVQAFRPRAALSDLDSAFLSKFESWHRKERKVTAGGLSVVMRTLRAACNRAVSGKIMPAAWYPFEGYSLAHLKSGKAKKSAGLEFIRALEGVELSSNAEQLARDLFLFSFYCRGVNLADMAEFTAANIQGGRLVYTRKKTGRAYSVGLSEKALAIIERHGAGSRLFPIYTGEEKTVKQFFYRKQTVEKQINRALRVIAARIGFDVPGLSFYTARHTYADSLKKAGVSVEVISQALGHADERTTDNYLKSFGDAVIDEADKLLD